MSFVSFVVNNVFVSLTTSQPGLTARPALTRNQLLAVGEVVIGQLFARLDITRRADPDRLRLADDVAVTIRFTGVIDESGDVAANVRIAYPAAIHGETPDAPLLQIPGLASQALLVIDQLASVIDDACVLVNGLESEYAPAVDSRAAAHDSRKFRFTWHPQRG